MESKKNLNLPSDEDFARADRWVSEAWRNLDEVCEAVKQIFSPLCRLHNIYILPQGDVTFRAYIFYVSDKDIKSCEEQGITERMKDSIYEELERAGRGKKGDITVAFEFDSDENVDRCFGGDYFDRLR